MADTLEDWLSTPHPGANANDAPAIASVLAALVANASPPRVEVARSQDGRLCVRGRPGARVGEITGYHVWYCCARYGRAVPVREWPTSSGSVGTPKLYDAPFTEFSCLANPPWNPNGPSDGWREIYDAALAALT